MVRCRRISHLARRQGARGSAGAKSASVGRESDTHGEHTEVGQGVISVGEVPKMPVVQSPMARGAGGPGRRGESVRAKWAGLSDKGGSGARNLQLGTES